MQQPKSGYAEVNGISMYYEQYGEGGIPLVLVHGGGSTIGSSFGNLLPALAGYGKIIAVELQAHGRTSDWNGPESFEQDADDIAALLTHLHLSKANILGFSNGGTTTLQLAIRHPGLVNKIIVISGVCKRDGLIAGFFEGMQQATPENMPEQLKTAYLNVAPDKSKLVQMFEKDKQRMIGFTDISDADIKSITAPALFLVSDKDVITTEHTLYMSRLLPGAKLAVLPGVHGECIGEVVTAKKDSRLPVITAMLAEDFLNDKY